MKQRFVLSSTLVVLALGVVVRLLAQEISSHSVRLRALMQEREEVLKNRAEILEMLVKDEIAKPIEAIDSHRDLIAV